MDFVGVLPTPKQEDPYVFQRASGSWYPVVSMPDSLARDMPTVSLKYKYKYIYLNS